MQEQQEQQESTLSASSEAETSTHASTTGGSAWRPYLVAGIVFVIISLTLVFFLERDGRLSTGIFSGIIEKLEAGSPVAKVNGVDISRKDFDTSYNQLLQMATAQGASTTDEQVIADFKTQTVDNLVNTELLRQAAIEAGKTATAEAVETRYGEIRDGLGGAEKLAERMTEIGVSEESLRRDIENELLIQGLFEDTLSTPEVTEEEVKAFYDQYGGESDGVPPLKDVYEQIVKQIERDRQNTEVQALLDKLRQEAKIEVLL